MKMHSTASKILPGDTFEEDGNTWTCSDFAYAGRSFVRIKTTAGVMITVPREYPVVVHLP